MSDAEHDPSASEPSPMALFRYLVVCQVLGRVCTGEPLADAVRNVAAVWHRDLSGKKQRVSARSLYRWLARYQEGGVARLSDEARPATGASIALSQTFLDFLAAEKKDDPRASIPEMIRRAGKRGIVVPEEVDRVTVYRACKRAGISVARRKKPRDARRWSYPHRMDMVLSDGKHFRAGATRAKRVALFYLDDCSRLGLDVFVGTSETTKLFLTGTHDVIAHHGKMTSLYLDNGPGFISHDTAAVIAGLGITLILGTAGYPEGHGKIERFNQTALADLLRGLDGRADVDPDCGALRLRLRHYLREEYSHRPHESLGGKTPWQRWLEDPRELRFPENRRALRAKFVVHLGRRVTGDNVVSINSVAYEMPRGHAGKRVAIRHQLLEGTFHFLHEGSLAQLHPVDTTANARSRRAHERDTNEPDAENSILPPSAADMAFAEDFSPVVDADGGFIDPAPEETHDEEESDRSL